MSQREPDSLARSRGALQRRHHQPAPPGSRAVARGGRSDRSGVGDRRAQGRPRPPRDPKPSTAAGRTPVRSSGQADGHPSRPGGAGHRDHQGRPRSGPRVVLRGAHRILPCRGRQGGPSYGGPIAPSPGGGRGSGRRPRRAIWFRSIPGGDVAGSSRGARSTSSRGPSGPRSRADRGGPPPSGLREFGGRVRDRSSPPTRWQGRSFFGPPKTDGQSGRLWWRRREEQEGQRGNRPHSGQLRGRAVGGRIPLARRYIAAWA